MTSLKKLLGHVLIFSMVFTLSSTFGQTTKTNNTTASRVVISDTEASTVVGANGGGGGGGLCGGGSSKPKPEVFSYNFTGYNQVQLNGMGGVRTLKVFVSSYSSPAALATMSVDQIMAQGTWREIDLSNRTGNTTVTTVRPEWIPKIGYDTSGTPYVEARNNATGWR